MDRYEKIVNAQLNLNQNRRRAYTQTITKNLPMAFDSVVRSFRYQKITMKEKKTNPKWFVGEKRKSA